MANRLYQNWRSYWQRRMENWLDRRVPIATSHKLNRHNLYTFPNLQGLLYLAALLVVWVMGTNYQNNLILGLCYLMASIFVVAILHGYANLAGLTIKFIGAEPVFAGDKAGFVVELSSDHRQGVENIRLRWDGSEADPISLSPGEPQRVTIWISANQRGYCRPRRLLLESYFPLGIIRCWTWLRLDARVLAYPRPLPLEEPRAATASGQEEGQGQLKRGEEFQGLRSYVPGDSLKHIAWKQFAQERGLYTKEYQEPLSSEKWLDWDSLSYDQEDRLACLCHWALAYEQRQLNYGLRLPGLELEPDHGPAQRSQVLTALALFNLPQVPQEPQP